MNLSHKASVFTSLKSLHNYTYSKPKLEPKLSTPHSRVACHNHSTTKPPQTTHHQHKTDRKFSASLTQRRARRCGQSRCGQPQRRAADPHGSWHTGLPRCQVWSAETELCHGDLTGQPGEARSLGSQAQSPHLVITQQWYNSQCRPKQSYLHCWQVYHSWGSLPFVLVSLLTNV